MAVTVREVAQRAGVTTGVVSRVLNDGSLGIRVSEATAERVREAAKELGYKRNILPVLMRAQQTKMIGVLHGTGFAPPCFGTGPRYFAALMDGIVAGAFSHGYTVALCPELMGDSPESAMGDGRFDGLLWYSNYLSDENRRLIDTSSVPLVLIHSPSSEFGGRFPAVHCDNDLGIRLAVAHLADLGHKRIAFAMEGAEPISETALRLSCFKRCMESLGLSVSPEDLIDVRLDRTGASEYLSASPRHTAIVAAHDGVAAALIHSAPRYGIRIPDDLSVIGFDSTSYCSELRPALTSVFQPLTDMGRAAAGLLVQKIAGQASIPSDTAFPCRLDIRDSTTRCKQ